MSDNKKRWIKRIIILVLDTVLINWVAISRYNSRLASDPISVFHALSDGFFVTGLLNLGFGALIWISTTGFFDIFSYSAKSILNFFIPRSMMERMGMTRTSGDFYEYKVKKQEKRGEPWLPIETLGFGVILIVFALIFTFLA